MEVIQSPQKRNPKGKFVSSDQKKMIINAYKHHLTQNPEAKMVHLKKELSEELGIGVGTIYQTILEYKRSKSISSPNRTKKFQNVKDKVDDFDKYAIRRKVHQFWNDREFPTLDKILQVINEDDDLPSFSRTSMYRLLKSMGFEYAKQGRNRREPCVLTVATDDLDSESDSDLDNDVRPLSDE